MKYAVIVNYRVHHEGDERSKTHPGHGYPEWTENIQRFHPFDSEEAMIRWVNYQSSLHSTFTLIKYEDLEVVKTINVRSSS